MTYFVYILYSEKIDRYYIGYSENPMLRLNTRHNLGKVKATKNGIPYRIVKMKEFDSEVLAMTEEKRLKKMKSRVYLKKLIQGNRYHLSQSFNKI